MKYAIAVNDLGTEYVHRYVGKEPSGLRFNKLFLNEDGKSYLIFNNTFTEQATLFFPSIFISLYLLKSNCCHTNVKAVCIPPGLSVLSEAGADAKGWSWLVQK